MGDATKVIGSFCWHELATRGADAARRFYGALMGWDVETDDTPMGPYHRWLGGGGEFGAVYELAGPMSEGVPPHWLAYVLVDDVDAAVTRARELGGSVHLEPTDVMEHGRMAVLADPTGAVFALWQARGHAGATCDRTAVGVPVWTELATRDRSTATDFYTGLFGWRAAHKSDGPTPYTEWWDGEACRGGMLEMTPEMGEAPPHWLTYFSVDDCDACVSKAEALGAHVCAPAMDIPGVGRMAVLTDPQGATFAVIAMAPGAI